MDYDDDDIPRHNLQLASEGRSKSSSALRPYDFPDFDFDNNLQGHLRFDSLVETEVFLGIQSQEDDKWIEDYSQVSNGMEFNSTPADSCSTRRDNVWSEATSSESVEMLLKSVGQEVMLPAESNIPGTNTCDDQGASATHVEPGSDLDIRKSETSQDEVHKDPSENRHLEVQLPSVEVSVLRSEDAELSSGHVQNLVQDTVCASSDIPANEELDTEPTEENLQHPETFVSHVTQVTVLITPEASEKIDATVLHVSCNESECETHPSSGTTLEGTMNLEGTTEKDSLNIPTLSDIPCLVPETIVFNSADSNKENPDGTHLMGSRDNSSERDIELVFPGGVDKDVSLESSAQTDTSDDKVLATSRASEIPLGGCQEGPPSDGNNQHSTEVGSLAEHCTSFDQTTDTSMQLIPEQDWISEDAQTSESQNKILSDTALLEVEDTKVSIEMGDWIVNTDIGKLRNTDLPSSETSLLAVEVNNVTMEKDSGHENTEMGKSNNKGLLSSDVEEHQSENVDGYANDSTFVQEGLGAHAVADVTGDSGKMVEENIGHALAEFSATGEAISEISHMDEKNYVSPKNMEFENVETPTVQLAIQPAGEDEAVQGNDTIHGVQNQTSGRSEADELALHTKSTDMDAVADHLEGGQGKISVTGFPVSDNNPEVVDVTKTDDAHLIREADKISEVESASDSTPCSLSEGAAASLQSVKRVDGMDSIKTLSPKAINSLDLDNSNVDMVSEKSNVHIGGMDNHEVTIIKPGGSQESPQTADADKASCGSPTIISSSEAPPSETNVVEEAKGSEVTENVVKGSQSTSEDIKGKESVGDDNTFTFKVSAMPDTSREPGKSWSPILDADKSNSPIVAKESTLTSEMKTAKLPSPKTPRQSVQIADVQLVQGSSKGTYERKGKRASGKGAGKESAKKGSQAKGPNQENSAGVVDKGPASSLSTPTSSPFVQFPHLQSYGKVDESSKHSHTGVLPTSNHADLSALSLNKSTSMSPISRQPFTDLQQVQLRAQIFVYGSLIQGTAPDEACMISAFGPSDTERISWDPVWRVAVERVRTQKSSSSITATPVPSHSGARVSDLAVKHNLNPSKLPVTPSNKVSSKDTPATVASPMIPLSSPLWSISTPSHDSLQSNTMHKGPVVDFQQTVTPMHSYQTPPMGSFNGHTPWQSQPSFRGPWLAPPQNATFSPSIRFQPVTMTETVKLTPVKDKSLPVSSGVKHMTSTSTTHSVGPSPVYVVSPPHDSKTISPPSELHSGDLKPRKRKKTPVSDHVHSASASEPQTLPVVIHSTGSLQSLPGFVSPSLNTNMIPPPPEMHSSDLKRKKRKKTSVSDLVHSGPALEPQSVPLLIHGTDGLQSFPLSVQAPTPAAAMDSCVAVDSTKAVACSEETLKSVAEAKIQAEKAAALANNAVGHCEDLWSKLPKQESELSSGDEKKLISAAAAIAAAVSVAKAAAAAANVAYNAALQAKLFADETFHSSNPDVTVSSCGKSTTDVQVVGNATLSGLKGGKSSIESTSILVAAKEAAKRRVEAASAASKQAENLDAIVKAAELAASAVSQAGKIVAMGDPLCLVDLIEAGPDGYWKLPHAPAEFLGKLRAENKDQSVAVDLKEVETHAMTSGEDSVAKRGSRKRSFGKTRQKENLKDILDPQRGTSDGITGSMDTDEKKPRSGRGRKRFIRETSEPESALSLKHSVDAQINFTGDLTESLDTDEKKSESKRDRELSTGVESEDALRTSGSQDENANLVGALLFDESIREGSSVEVLKCGGSLKTAWYSAIVLELNDRKAYVCYNDLSSDKGSGSFCEWVRLDGEGEKAPVIRVAQPVNALQYQGTRKRRRAALGDYAWGVGDQVDAWVDDCWWEGVVTEKNEKDETTLKVHFPAQFETSTVKAWNLRTSRSWIDGRWEECSSSWKAHHPSAQTDTPQEKRRKMGNPIVATPGKDKLYNEGKLAAGNAVESEHLPLATSERTFNVGKSTKEDGKVVGRRPLRTGPQKEGSRVVFGVPKPTGKMRKFMDVSKHYPASKGDKSKEIYDPSKYAKHPMSQATGSQGWKVPSRNFSRDKRIVESKSKIPGTRKSHRTLPQRDNFSSRSGDVDSGTDNGTDIEDANGREVNSSVKTTRRGFGVSDEPAEAPLSSLLSNTFSAASKRVPLSNSRPARLNRGKLAPSGGKLSKIEEDKVAGSGKFVDEATEPRRSNRRFQPTHRLLEGLQSSMVIPKMPSVTHVKAQRNPSRSVLTRGK